MTDEQKISLHKAAAELGITPEELVDTMIYNGELSELEGELLLNLLPELMVREAEDGVVFNYPGMLWAEIRQGVLETVVSLEAGSGDGVADLEELISNLELPLLETSVGYNPEFFGNHVSISRYALH